MSKEHMNRNMILAMTDGLPSTYRYLGSALRNEIAEKDISWEAARTRLLELHNLSAQDKEQIGVTNVAVKGKGKGGNKKGKGKGRKRHNNYNNARDDQQDPKRYENYPCENCGKYGHRAKDCRSRGKGGGKSYDKHQSEGGQKASGKQNRNAKRRANNATNKVYADMLKDSRPDLVQQNNQ